MLVFEVGKQYSMSSVCDSKCVWIYEVIKRTAKTVTLQQIDRSEKPIVRRISIWNDRESVMPLGTYSMAPCLTAEKLVKAQEQDELPEVVEPQQEAITSADTENPYRQPEIKDGFIYDCHFKAWDYEPETIRGALIEECLTFEDWGEKFGFFGISADTARKVKVMSDANGSILFIDDEKPEPQKVEPSVTPSNVLDFTARLKAKQEQEATQKAIDKFKADYLPYVTIEDAQEIAKAQETQQAGIIARICMRIDLERRVK